MTATTAPMAIPETTSTYTGTSPGGSFPPSSTPSPMSISPAYGVQSRLYSHGATPLHNNQYAEEKLKVISEEISTLFAMLQNEAVTKEKLSAKVTHIMSILSGKQIENSKTTPVPEPLPSYEDLFQSVLQLSSFTNKILTAATNLFKKKNFENLEAKPTIEAQCEQTKRYESLSRTICQKNNNNSSIVEKHNRLIEVQQGRVLSEAEKVKTAKALAALISSEQIDLENKKHLNNFKTSRNDFYKFITVWNNLYLEWNKFEDNFRLCDILILTAFDFYDKIKKEMPIDAYFKLSAAMHKFLQEIEKVLKDSEPLQIFPPYLHTHQDTQAMKSLFKTICNSHDCLDEKVVHHIGIILNGCDDTLISDWSQSPLVLDYIIKLKNTPNNAIPKHLADLISVVESARNQQFIYKYQLEEIYNQIKEDLKAEDYTMLQKKEEAFLGKLHIFFDQLIKDKYERSLKVFHENFPGWKKSLEDCNEEASNLVKALGQLGTATQTKLKDMNFEFERMKVAYESSVAYKDSETIRAYSYYPYVTIQKWIG